MAMSMQDQMGGNNLQQSSSSISNNGFINTLLDLIAKQKVNYQISSNI